MLRDVPLQALIVLFLTLLTFGLALTLPLYKFNLRKFRASSLFVKIIFWIPIFAVFTASLYLSNSWRLVVVAFVLLMALRDLLKVLKKTSRHDLALFYFAVFSGLIIYFYILGKVFPEAAINLLITICIASVLADVTAFFLGNYFGRHKLPSYFNDKKSWEGVFGQILGALLGVVLVARLVQPVSSIALFLPIGLGSVAGDLMNSYVKRHLKIKDWGNSIPGHGGYLDRFASLGGSLCFTFYWVLFFKLY